MAQRVNTPKCLSDIAYKAVLDNIDRLDKDLVRGAIVSAPNFQHRKLKEMWRILKITHASCSFKYDGEVVDFDKLWASLPFLISSKTYTKFNLSNLPSVTSRNSTISNSRFQELFRCIGTNTPNLEEIILYGRKFPKFSLEIGAFDSISKLKNLAILVIKRVHVPLSGISLIMSNCKNIKKIRANDIETDIEPSRCCTYSNSFKFVITYERDRQSSRRQLSLKIDTISQKDIDNESLSVYWRNADDNTNLPVAYCTVRGITRGTEIYDEENLNEFSLFRNVKRAEIICDLGMVQNLRDFLRRSGWTIERLKMKFEDKISLSELFGFCPNLKTLEFYSCYLSGNDAPVEAMHQLKTFVWLNDLSKIEVPKVAFSSVLSAPLLQEVIIRAQNFDFSDNDTVITRIANGEILRNLQKFNIISFCSVEVESIEEQNLILLSIERLKELKNAMISAIKNRSS
ncbi:Hypothetical predicted protein [Cloeon dipterum]|uniref:Uncharacterized protein n=1 Tax=Cloeon dipterum TaxID=197152 RepID=A0A8S1CNU0_9INSE|nr:Hypothetical predicted protein [Cloeon dipterum]